MEKTLLLLRIREGKILNVGQEHCPEFFLGFPRFRQANKSSRFVIDAALKINTIQYNSFVLKQYCFPQFRNTFGYWSWSDEAFATVYKAV